MEIKSILKKNTRVNISQLKQIVRVRLKQAIENWDNTQAKSEIEILEKLIKIGNLEPDLPKTISQSKRRQELINILEEKFKKISEQNDG